MLTRIQRDVAVPVALLAMATLEVHRYMALVLAPMCPKAFRAQVKALSKTLDKVLNLTLSLTVVMLRRLGPTLPILYFQG